MEEAKACRPGGLALPPVKLKSNRNFYYKSVVNSKISCL